MTQNSNYDARQHLVQIRSKDGTMKDYLPANWRLYQARLEHPDIVLESEILHLDPEHNFVIVKATVFVGTDYASSTFKCSAMKQGLLTQLDRVETAAKARALRDLGISTELALDHDDSDADDVPTTPPQRPTQARKPATSNHSTQATQPPPAQSAEDVDELNAIRAECKMLKLADDATSWAAFKIGVLGVQVRNYELTTDHLVLLRHAVEDAKMAGIPSSPAA